MPAPLHIVVAGGGIAAVELLLALRGLAEERVTLELVAPGRELHVRATGTRADLADLAADAGATFRQDALEAVAPTAHRARLASGAVARYDALVLALGTRARAAVPGAITLREPADARKAADARRLVLAAPAGVTWTLPLYEAALASGAEEVTLVTPERAPLAVFGSEVSAGVGAVLADRGVRFLGGTTPRAAGPAGLELSFGGRIGADAVVAVPQLHGRRISGVPGDWNGFVQTDGHGRVEGLFDVFAAGDMTTFPVKQGGLAAQQADVIATLLAQRAGADVPEMPVRHVLRTRLLGTDEPLYLHAELDGDGVALRGSVDCEPPWWPGAKVFGRYITPALAA